MEAINQLYFSLIYAKGKAPGTHRIGGSVGPNADQILGKKKFSFSHRESNRVR